MARRARNRQGTMAFQGETLQGVESGQGSGWKRAHKLR